MNGLNHIAFIMDGNGRWAKMRQKTRGFGHKHGAETMKKIVSHAFSRGVKVLSFYAFSTENWARPKEEVDNILSLLMKLLSDNINYLTNNHIRLTVSGDISVLSAVRRKRVEEAVFATRNFEKTVNILFNYGGRNEILNAVNTLLKSGATEVSAEDFEKLLYTKDLPPVDLLIRPGGEKRLSNCLLWQSAYAELYFSDVLWPDFSEKDLDEAISWFETRQRRFGNIPE